MSKCCYWPKHANSFHNSHTSFHFIRKTTLRSHLHNLHNPTTRCRKNPVVTNPPLPAGCCPEMHPSEDHLLLLSRAKASRLLKYQHAGLNRGLSVGTDICSSGLPTDHRTQCPLAGADKPVSATPSICMCSRSRLGSRDIRDLVDGRGG